MRLPMGEVAIRRGATGARAGWAGREAEAQWEEGERPVGKKKKNEPRLGRKAGWAGSDGKNSFLNKI
jgi:hypothetical protein